MKAIKGSINVDNIDKARLFDGKKGRYLDIVLVPTPNGKYYEWMIVQDTPEGEETIILGNAGKIFGKDNPTQPKDEEVSSDLPF